jgi:hypothetical protein
VTISLVLIDVLIAAMPRDGLAGVAFVPIPAKQGVGPTLAVRRLSVVG